MFISGVLFTIAKTLETPKCSLTKQWIKKMCYTYIYMYIHTHTNGVLVIKRMK